MPFWLGIGVVLGVAVSVGATPATEDGALQVVRVLGEDDHAVAWVASVHAVPGIFRIYAGSSLRELELVGQQPATAGLDSYRFISPYGGAERVVYVLRYVVPDGTELSLGSLVVSHGSVTNSATSTSVPARSGPVAPSEDRLWLIAGWERAPQPEAETIATTPRPAPDVPPPRPA